MREHDNYKLIYLLLKQKRDHGKYFKVSTKLKVTQEEHKNKFKITGGKEKKKRKKRAKEKQNEREREGNKENS